ncbi:MAG TPA: hypothetical protein VK922_04370 [Gemmatimonadaceae bacterium]|nr:hypothetical protein [Gemmatimonadaceae bacterium]
MRPSLLTALALVSLLASRPAHGQLEDDLFDPRDNTKGLALGVRGGFVSGLSTTGERNYAGIDLATTWGSGVGLQVGYGYSPRLLFYGSVDHSWVDSDNTQVIGDLTLYHFDFGVRYHLHLRDVRYVPYVSLALGGKQLYTRSFIDTLGVSRPATINGRAIVPGAGMQLFVTEDLAVDGQVAVSIGGFGKIDVDGGGRRMYQSSGGQTVRVLFGASWYPER